MISVGLIGCGRVAGHHCQAIDAADNVRLGAVCDLIEKKAAEYGSRDEVPHYVNYHEMLSNHPDINYVAIITPSGMHYEHAMDVIKTHHRNIIVEKPTFLRPSQLNSIYNFAGAHGLKIYPIFQNRYNKAVVRVRRAITEGELGDIRAVNVRVRWCRPQSYYDLAPWRGTLSHDGGVLTNQSIHHVDLLRHLVGKIAKVQASMTTLGVEIEAEDTVVATFEYTNGALGSLEATTAARPDDFEASISLVGSIGLAQIGGVAVNKLQIFTPDPSACAENSEDFIGIKGHGAVYGFGHVGTYADIVADALEGRTYPVSRKDALGTITLLHAFYKSAEIGASVNVSNGLESTKLGQPNETISDLYRTPAAVEK